MPTSSFPKANENKSRPVVQLDIEELCLVASFVDLVLDWREHRSSSGDEFHALWHRMKVKSPDVLDDEDVMSDRLGAQQSARRSRA